MKVVMQIEAEADPHEDPEDSQPDQRSPAIVTWRPGCRRMDMHPRCPPLSGKETYSYGQNNKPEQWTSQRILMW
jgi:hypothetical protein